MVVCDQMEQPKGTKQYECKLKIRLPSIAQEDIIDGAGEAFEIRSGDVIFSFRCAEVQEKSTWLTVFHSMLC